jgi:hypothetical protein
MFSERINKQDSSLLVKSKPQEYRKTPGLLVDSYTDSNWTSAWSITGLEFSTEGVT